MSNQQDKNAPTSDSDNNLGRGASTDHEERIRQRAHELWESDGRPEGRAQEHWERAAQDLDREDAELQREGIADSIQRIWTWRYGAGSGWLPGSAEQSN